MELQRILCLLAAGFALLALCPRPALAKTGGTYYTDADVAAIRARAASPDYRKELDAILKKAEVLAGRSDEEIWQLIPEADLPRALNVCFGVGCPVHGAEVFKVGGHYPWIMSPDLPFKVQCPVGKEFYPSNDFEAYLKSGRAEKLDTTEPYVDDGGGWVAPDGQRYWFVGFYVFWEHWRHTIIDGLAACYQAYLATGEPRYAHKCAVALARISQVYPKMDYSTQAYHNGKYPAAINGRILDYIWENSTVSTFAMAYDAIFSTLETDAELKALAGSKGVPDVGKAIERDLLQVAVSDIFQKKIWGNKFELGSLSTIALALDNDDPANGATTDEMLDWLLKGGGELEFTLYNGFDRDGIGGESSPSYSAIWNDRYMAAAENLARMGRDIVTDPRWLRIARGPSEMRLLENLSPRLGDCGGDIMGAPRLVDADLLKLGASHFGDPYCARLLLERKLEKPRLLDRQSLDLEKLKKLAAKDDFPDTPYTRDMGGYGLAILEMDDGGGPRSATMYYGTSGASHGHKDRLTIGYHMLGRDVLTDLGYPSHWGPVADNWIKNTPSHYCVMIDEDAQPVRAAGHLTRFADLPGLKLAEAQAARVWQGKAADYRRLMALLDTGMKSTLLVDAFFVEGGTTHDYDFHGLPFGEFSTDCELVREQGGGTVAGPDVDYGVDPGGGKGGSGYQFLTSPRWYRPGEVARFRWTGDNGLDMTAWFPRLSFGEVIVADGKPPVKPGYPDSIPYILLRGRGQDLSSLFLGIVDVNKGESPVREVLRIRSDHPKAGGAAVRLVDGRQWRIYVNGSGAEAAFEDGVRMDADFSAALVSGSEEPLRDLLREAEKLYVVGEGALRFGGRSIARSAGPAPATVRNVDYGKGLVWLSEKDRFPAPGRGRVAFFQNGEASASYTVRSVSRDGGTAVLGFGPIGLITGRFEAAWDASAGRIISKERLGGVYNQFVAKSFVGMYAVSEDKSFSAPITAYDATENTFTVDASPEDCARFRDADGDGRSYVYIADIGPGTKVSATPYAVIQREPER